jgi:hypothetical protein
MSDVQQNGGVYQEVADRWIQALGGRAAVERAAVQRTRATGLRRHPGWGSVPGDPELVVEFLFDLVEDPSAAPIPVAVERASTLGSRESRLHGGRRGFPCSPFDNVTKPRSKAIPLTVYAPLAQGRAANYPTRAAISRKHGATAAQVAIAWLLDQEGVIAIPKAGRPESQKANLEALTTSLDDEDRAAIAALPKDQRFVRPPFAPESDRLLKR